MGVSTISAALVVGGGLWYKLPLNFEVREPQASHVIPASLSCFSNDPQVHIYVTERREVM